MTNRIVIQLIKNHIDSSNIMSYDGNKIILGVKSAINEFN